MKDRKTLTVWINEKQKELLKAEAEKMETTISAVVRNIIRNYLENKVKGVKNV
jgi:hypothetical protein